MEQKNGLFLSSLLSTVFGNVYDTLPSQKIAGAVAISCLHVDCYHCPIVNVALTDSASWENEPSGTLNVDPSRLVTDFVKVAEH